MKPITNQPITFLTHQSIMKMKHFFIAIACLCSVLSMSTRAQAQAAGSLDPTFGVGGRVELNNLPNQDINDGIPLSTAVSLQADNKIVVTGYYRESGQNINCATLFLVRINTNGTMDTNFGEIGRAHV